MPKEPLNKENLASPEEIAENQIVEKLGYLAEKHGVVITGAIRITHKNRETNTLFIHPGGMQVANILNQLINLTSDVCYHAVKIAASMGAQETVSPKEGKN